MILSGKNMPSKYTWLTGSHLLSDRSNLWNFRRRNVSRFEMFWANHPKKSVVWNTFIFHRQVEVPLNDTLSLFVCQVPGAANRFQEMMRCWDPKLGTALQEFPGPFEWIVSMENRKIMRKYGNTMNYIWDIHCKWRLLAGKMISKWGIAHCHVLLRAYISAGI